MTQLVMHAGGDYCSLDDLRHVPLPAEKHIALHKLLNPGRN
jgi:hypothetical protein